MKLKYQPDDLVITQDDADRPIVATLSMATLSVGQDVHVLGALMAAAPQMLAALDYLTSVEADDEGDRTASPEVMGPIWDAIDAAGGHQAVQLIEAL